ncbi:MAG: hypothetical protein WC197_05425 [Candidatus Gastranaerophilaceae bacterium]|jgi:hypothetical protein
MNVDTILIENERFLIKPKYSPNSIHELMQNIKEAVINNDYEDMIIDLSGFNLIYASQIGILTGIQHFIKYPEGTLEIIVDSEEAKNMIVLLNIANARISVQSEKNVLLGIA